MDEASQIFAQHGVRAIAILQGMIVNALNEGEEVLALHLDNVLEEVERLVQEGTTQP